MHLVAFFQEQFGEIGSILTGNARDQRTRHECISAMFSGSTISYSLSENRRGLAHFAMPCEQNVPVPLSSAGSRIGI